MDPSIKSNLEDINRLAQKLESPIYLVGGTVRDHLLERSCADYDFAAPLAPAIARAFADKVKRTRVPLDETPGRETYRVVIHKELYFDFTTLQGGSIEDDLAHRDFTINAMAIALADFVEGKINLIDPFNGENDLKFKFIRVLSKQTFKDDPLRLLRAFRFAATLGFHIEPGTRSQFYPHVSLLNDIAKERVTYELLLLFGAAWSGDHLRYMPGLKETLYPHIAVLETTPGNRANTTAWDDTLSQFGELERLLLQPEDLLEKHAQLIKDYLKKNHHYALLKWSALVSLMPPGNNSTFDLVEFFREFRLSNSDIHFVECTLKFSRIILSGARSSADGFKEDSTLYQLIHRSGNELISSILLSLAIRLGNQEDIKYFLPLIHRILDFYTQRYLPAQDKPVLLDGDVLKKRFQLEPSPRFKFILDKVEEARVLGSIQTPDEAEELAKILISSPVEQTE